MEMSVAIKIVIAFMAGVTFTVFGALLAELLARTFPIFDREPEPEPDKEPPKAQAVRLNSSQAGPNVDVRALYPQPGKKPARSLALVERQAREIVAHCDLDGYRDSGDEHKHKGA